VRERHAAWCRALVERATPGLNGGDDHLRWLDRVEAEHDNLRAALAWRLEHDPDAGLRQLAPGLARFWLIRSFFAEGRRWLARLLAAAPAPTGERTQALRDAAALARNGGDRAAAWRLGEEGLAVSRALGDRARIAECLSERGGGVRLPRRGGAGARLARGGRGPRPRDRQSVQPRDARVLPGPVGRVPGRLRPGANVA
jgi:non-specific serine/threonine protein kinase